MSYFVETFLDTGDIITIIFKDKDVYNRLFLEESFITNLDVFSKGTVHSIFYLEESSSEETSDED